MRSSGITASGPASPISAAVGLLTMPPVAIAIMDKNPPPRPLPGVTLRLESGSYGVVGAAFGMTGPMKPGSPGFFAPGVEGMTDMSGSKRDIYADVIASILALIIAILIVAFVGKWLKKKGIDPSDTDAVQKALKTAGINSIIAEIAEEEIGTNSSLLLLTVKRSKSSG